MLNFYVHHTCLPFFRSEFGLEFFVGTSVPEADSFSLDIFPTKQKIIPISLKPYTFQDEIAKGFLMDLNPKLKNQCTI